MLCLELQLLEGERLSLSFHFSDHDAFIQILDGDNINLVFAFEVKSRDVRSPMEPASDQAKTLLKPLHRPAPFGRGRAAQSILITE